MITSRQFRQRTGRKPVQDDLERCNCPHAGKPGHTMCGWSERRNLPMFMVGWARKRPRHLRAKHYRGARPINFVRWKLQRMLSRAEARCQ